jgi:serine protease Do
MKKILQILMIIMLIGCNEKANQKNNDEENFEIRKKELDLKEKELDLRAQELNQQNELNKQNQTEIIEKPNLSSIYGTVKNGVYLIYTQKDEGVSQGSAFVVDKSGLSISNFHVFENASSAIAINELGDEFMISEIIEYDKEKDFIIFRLGNQNDIPFLQISNQTPSIGEPCFAIGNPKGLTQTLSTGIISGYRNGNEKLQTTTSITYGSSGGPLFNEKGQVIGVTTSGYGEANLNFAININTIPIEKYINRINSVESTSNLTEKEVKKIVSNYYETIESENWNQLLTIYAKNLTRFFDKFNIANYEAVTSAKNYKSKFGVSNASYNIRWNTLNYSSSNLGTTIQFTMDYQITRNDLNKPSNFILDIIMVVDNENKIKSINENIISKK